MVREVQVQFKYAVEDKAIRLRAIVALGKISKDNPKVIEAESVLMQIVQNTGFKSIRLLVPASWGKIDKDNPKVIQILNYLNEVFEKGFAQLNQILSNYSGLDMDCYGTLWNYAQNMSYPAFYQALHQQEKVGKTTTADRQSLNQADLPQSLQSAIANDPQLSQTIHLICIDGSQFIEPDRPAAEIYDQMLDQNCPECDSVPETMPALKLYWNSLRRKSDKRPVLVFYEGNPHNPPNLLTKAPACQGENISSSSLPPLLRGGRGGSNGSFSPTVLTDLSKFGDRICVVTNQPIDHIPLKYFAPSQPIEDVMQWIRAIATSL